MSSKLILVLGAGPRVGLNVVKKFADNGYKTVGVSRNPGEELSKVADLALSADFSKHESIKTIFDEVKSKVGVPNVVVYNGAANHGAKDPFDVSVEDFILDSNINIVSAYAALQQAIQAFKELPKGTPKTFIYTGNGLTHMNLPALMNNGMGKRAALYLIENAAQIHGDQGTRFYYADEREAGGAPVYGRIDGPAHGEFYYELASSEKTGPYEATFVKGKGYFDFEGGIGAK
ncbi:NAD(P)-binding protein [Mollisia scopiformis]|uniref:NAD(P)-binding protein n=1 Tax=Mollisia scopiformis TaxID=149040 RepID=A0A194XRC7_MOLSC|nr:NAD(P)-binding protein [Mollisia scopiformis]KUJ22706.1 NAD(P)-binding protein [Mollisia scopiformis]